MTLSRLTVAFVVVIAVLAILTPFSADGQGSAEGDRAALVALYDALNGPGWRNQTGWTSPRPIRDWHGVFVGTGGRVRSLQLADNWLQGEIPPEIGDLTNLESLSLGDNRITGEIPPEIGRLTNLTGLGIGEIEWWRATPKPNLTGRIPNELSNLVNLEYLNLIGNSLTGEIPSYIADLRKLRTVWLNDNNLTGEIPRGLENLLDLGHLRLDNNNLTGGIPRELADLTRLDVLNLRYNNLTGTIPYELRRFRNQINPQQGGVRLPIGTPVPALPFVGALLLACGLWRIGRRKMLRPH